MKKNYLLTIIVCLFTLGTTAQPVITYGGNAPQIGDIYNITRISGTFDPGSVGGNQNRDFSDVGSSDDSWNIDVMTPESTPFSDEFPESNLAYYSNGGNDPDAYIYLQLSEPEMLHNGNVNNPGSDQFIIHYTDAAKVMQYPFSYSDTYTNSYDNNYSLPEGMSIHETGTITETADAWGSLKTPAGTYNNVMRIKLEMVYTDSIWAGGIFLYEDNYDKISYEWYTATSHYSVLTISSNDPEVSAHSLALGISVTDAWLTYSSLIGGIEDNPLLSQITVWPNPTDNIISVKLSDEITDKIEIEIVDLTGQLLMPLKKSGNRQFSADISRLTPGVYLLRLKGSSGIAATSKFIVER